MTSSSFTWLKNSLSTNITKELFKYLSPISFLSWFFKILNLLSIHTWEMYMLNCHGSLDNSSFGKSVAMWQGPMNIGQTSNSVSVYKQSLKFVSKTEGKNTLVDKGRREHVVKIMTQNSWVFQKSPRKTSNTATRSAGRRRWQRRGDGPGWRWGREASTGRWFGGRERERKRWDMRKRRGACRGVARWINVAGKEQRHKMSS